MACNFFCQQFNDRKSATTSEHHAVISTPQPATSGALDMSNLIPDDLGFYTIAFTNDGTFTTFEVFCERLY